jgi:purine-binding chemotaxis protein CheW
MTTNAIDPREVLRARAALLAQELMENETPDSKLDVVEFRLGPEHYGLALTCIREITPHATPVCIPGTPAWVAGLVNVRGEVLVVLDLARLFELPLNNHEAPRRIMVLAAADFVVGVQTDEILGTRRLTSAQLKPPFPSVGGLRTEWIRGITSEGVTILDGDRLLASESILVQHETDT